MGYCVCCGCVAESTPAGHMAGHYITHVLCPTQQNIHGPKSWWTFNDSVVTRNGRFQQQSDANLPISSYKYVVKFISFWLELEFLL